MISRNNLKYLMDSSTIWKGFNLVHISLSPPPHIFFWGGDFFVRDGGGEKPGEEARGTQVTQSQHFYATFGISSNNWFCNRICTFSKHFCHYFL